MQCLRYDKGLISKKFKEFLKKKKKIGISIEKWAKDSKEQFIEVETKLYYEKMLQSLVIREMQTRTRKSWQVIFIRGTLRQVDYATC